VCIYTLTDHCCIAVLILYLHCWLRFGLISEVGFILTILIPFLYSDSGYILSILYSSLPCYFPWTVRYCRYLIVVWNACHVTFVALFSVVIWEVRHCHCCY